VSNRWLSFVLFSALSCTGALAQKQPAAQNDRQVLQEILQQTYQPSLVGKQLLGFGGETDIRRAGTIVVIQRPGLYGSFLHSEPASSSITGLKCELFRGHKDYEVPVGERYYVTSVNVASSTVLVGLISARSVPAHTGAGRLWTTLSFNFPDQVLATAEKETVFRAFDQWFLPEGRGVSAAPPATAAPAAVPAAVAPAPAAVPSPASAPQPAPSPAAAQGTSRVSIQSEPAGAEIYLDGEMVGSTPSTLMVPSGSHQFRVHAPGRTDWTRTVNILPGSEISLTAALDKN
jgi:hypothetical protein